MSAGSMNPALMPMLTLAVIKDLDEVRQLSERELRSAAVTAADGVAAGADWIIRDERPRSGKAGREEYLTVWKSLVRGIAIASLQPGGATILGQHFDAAKWPFSEAGGGR